MKIKYGAISLLGISIPDILWMKYPELRALEQIASQAQQDSPSA